MLGDVIAIEAEPVVQLDQLQAVLVEFRQRQIAAVDVISEMTPVGEPDEFVNLTPTTGPVPLMVKNQPAPEEPAEVAEVEVEVAAVDEVEQAGALRGVWRRRLDGYDLAVADDEQVFARALGQEAFGIQHQGLVKAGRDGFALGEDAVDGLAAGTVANSE